MTRLSWTFLRSAGWPRAALLTGTTALATALLLVSRRLLWLASLWLGRANPWPELWLAFGTAMLVLPLLVMLNQVVRLGTATRERRLAALRLAGATPSQVRRLGAFEVGFPVTVGAMAGPLVFALVRASSSGRRFDFFDSLVSLKATSVPPPWWQTVAVVALVAAAGVATGALASRHLIASPLGVSRRTRRPAPRPWGLLPVAAGLSAVALVVNGSRHRDSVTLIMVFGPGQSLLLGILLVALGVIALGPWLAFRSGRRAARRTCDPATLIAAGHLVSDPGPAGRAAALVGAIGTLSGATAVLEVLILFPRGLFDLGQFHGRNGPAMIGMALLLVAPPVASLILVLIVSASTLAVHAAESLVDRRRVLAALVAAGTPRSVLAEALRREAMLTSMPMSVGGALTGVVATALILDALNDSGGMTLTLNLATLLFVSGQVSVTIGLTWVAIRIAIGAVAPRLVQATAPANLRTE